MASTSGDELGSEEQQLRDLAQQLRNLSTTTAGNAHEDSIVSFATQAESYANRMRDASSPAAVEALEREVARKRTQWTQLLELLTLATHIEHEDDNGDASSQEAVPPELAGALQAAEEQLRNTASQLRAVAAGGTTDIFNAIGRVASEAETGLADFLAAESSEEKLQVYARVQEARAQWVEQMESLHSTVLDGSESQAPTEVPDASDVCEYVDDAEDSCCKPANESKEITVSTGCTMSSAGYASGGYGNYFASMGCSPNQSASSSAVPEASPAEAPSTVASSAPLPTPQVLSDLTAEAAAALSPADAREQIAIYLSDDGGLLATLRRTVAEVKEDARFEGVHEDASNLLEQMELAAGAIIPEALVEEFANDLAGAEDKLKATIEPMRKAQWGGFYAKKAAFAVQKYDLYVRKGKMPSLKDEHSELLECARVSVDVAGFLHKQAQNAIMDSVTGLVAKAT